MRAPQGELIVNRLGVLNRPGVFATPVPRLRGRKQERFVPALPEVPGVGGLRTPDLLYDRGTVREQNPNL